MGRKILFVTTDQMRYDALGCNGGRIARTPVIDSLASSGINYSRAHAVNVVCMPARATMISGQTISSHGVWMNGVPLAPDSPSVAHYLKQKAGYKTALIGKAHFEPFLDIRREFYENTMSDKGEHGPHRGFDHMELATHSPLILHYGRWLREHASADIARFYRNLNEKFEVNAEGGGETGACQVWHNETPREHYHTDWCADRAIAWLDGLQSTDDWFLWLSFPDPHHPWDPPKSEIHRHNWRNLSAPVGYPGSAARAEKLLANKPKHWLGYFHGRMLTNFEAPPEFVPAAMTADQLREIDAMTHVENELIDEALGRVLAAIRRRGWDADTDIIFSTDHGELQGDFGLLFKGPYHVDSLMRLPCIWRPAPSAGIMPARIDAPVGQLDFAPTIAAIAGLETPVFMEGKPLPRSSEEAAEQRRQRSFTEWDCAARDATVSLGTMYCDGWIVTRYLPSTIYDGSEGELYDLKNDPLQWNNLWDDLQHRATKSELLADLKAHGPAEPSFRRPPVANV